MTRTVVPLGKLASVYEKQGRYNILHDGARRVQTISLNVAGGNAEAFVSNAQAQIARKVHLAAGDYGNLRAPPQLRLNPAVT